MDEELPKVTGVHIIHVSQDLPAEEIQGFMEDWIAENSDISTDPGEVVIFSPYQMDYTLTDTEDDGQILFLVGYMAREKWATLSDADDLRKFAFQLEESHKNLKVGVELALSVKEPEEADKNYNFVTSYFEKNEEVRDMLMKMQENSDLEDDENLFGSR